MVKPYSPRTKRQKAAKSMRRDAVSAERLDALLGNKTVTQIQAEAAAAQAAERRELLRQAEQRDREAVASKTN